ncbi:MAG: hypothetical protein JSS35_04205, partial [Proteobacteria bacterium]|nr:hypothetical protein [Pseudomonadota bacterium]
MKLKLAAAAIAGVTLIAGAACAEDFVTIPMETTVNAPADKAWPKISGYCLIGDWIKGPGGKGVGCEITSGKDGQVGAVRT